MPACTPACWQRAPRPDALAEKDESDLVVALGPHLDSFVAALFGIEAETLALARETAALDPIHACKRLFVQRQAVKKYPDPAGFDGAALRAALEARDGRAPDRTRLRQARRHVGETVRSASARTAATAATASPPRSRAALRRLGDADAQRAAPRIAGGTLFGVPHRLDYNHLVPVETIERDGVTMLRLPEHDWRAARRLCADRSRHEPPAGAGPDELLHLVPHPGQGFLQHRPEGPQDRSSSRNRRSA